jgi:CubicO group peptidase (beta-lactamase class C family)
MGLLSTRLWLWSGLVALTAAACHHQSPAFPPPDYSQTSSPELLEAFGHIQASLSALMVDEHLATSSYSIEVTSKQSTLWSSFHTATETDPKRPGAARVAGDSAYRIASITKVFTVRGILEQHAAENLSLDDSVDQYVEGLDSHSHEPIPWKDMTLRSLASQLSGLPRDWAQGDLITDVPDPTLIGLPPTNSLSGLPQCDSFSDYQTPCTADDLLETVNRRPPLFAPNQKSTYSNIAFELLGLVLANVTGSGYEDYIEASILKPLNMTGTSFSRPSDDVAVLPKNNRWYWDVDEGVQNPTGGLYSTSADMSRFLRHVLATYNGVTPALNWFHPASFSGGVHSFYGIPWEIFRTDRILGGRRPVTFVTKAGGLPGYTTFVALVPEYELGVTLLTAGDSHFLDQVREIVTVPLIRAADEFARRRTRTTYAGLYVADGPLNSSIELSYTDQSLEVVDWISNGTDMMSALPVQFQLPQTKFHLQVIPTLLYRHEKQQQGELWRVVLMVEQSNAVWDDFCMSDVDIRMYAGRPFNELVFWSKDAETGGYDTVELTAFRVTLTRQNVTEEERRPPPRGQLLTQDGH